LHHNLQHASETQACSAVRILNDKTSYYHWKFAAQTDSEPTASVTIVGNGSEDSRCSADDYYIWPAVKTGLPDAVDQNGAVGR
jgi:hypothetical protein